MEHIHKNFDEISHNFELLGVNQMESRQTINIVTVIMQEKRSNGNQNNVSY